MKKIAVILLIPMSMAMAQFVNAATCEEVSQADVFGKYEGRIDGLTWNSGNKEVLENKCTWDVSLRISRLRQNASTCSLQGELTAKPIAQENYSPEGADENGKIYDCASLDKYHTDLRLIADDLRAPFKIVFDPYYYPASVPGVRSVWPKYRLDEFVKKSDGDINFNDPREGASRHRSVGTLIKGRD